MHFQRQAIRPRTALRRQSGNAAIEFALVFPLFFALFYAIVSYAMLMTVEQALTEAAKEGARAAFKVDPIGFPNNPNGYSAKVSEEARTQMSLMLQWLPAKTRDAMINAQDAVKVDTTNFPTTSSVSILLNYPSSNPPLLPPLVLPFIGKIPNVPENLTVTAYARL